MSFPMKTGFSIYDEPGIDDDLREKSLTMLFLLIEKAFKTASTYVKAAHRFSVTQLDMKYALIYEAHVFFQRDSLEQEFHDAYLNQSSSSDCDEDALEVTDETDEPFTRAVSDDPQIQQMNLYFDEWDSWNPSDPIQRILKKAIDQM